MFLSLVLCTIAVVPATRGHARSERMYLLGEANVNSRAKFNIFDYIVVYPTFLDIQWDRHLLMHEWGMNLYK